MARTQVTFSNVQLLRPGDRITVGGMRAVLKRVESPTVVTIAWRYRWYWRLLEWWQDEWRRDLAWLRKPLLW